MKLINKNLLIITITIISLCLFSAPAFAQDDREHLRLRRLPASLSAEMHTKRLEDVKKQADRMIQNRISKLNRIIERIQKDKNLLSDEKSLLTSEVQNSIDELNKLKAKIDADTTIDEVKTDIKSVINNFKVYSVLVPKIRLMIAIDDLQKLSTRAKNVTSKLQDLINKLKNQGKDVTTLQSNLDGVNLKLNTIDAKLSNDKSILTNVSISTSNPESIFVNIRQDLASVRNTFSEIRHEIRQINQLFKEILHKNSNGATPTPSPTI